MKFKSRKEKNAGRKGQAAIGKPAVSARSRRGQAAMEYLMTYGWAILVLVIVLAVLAYFLPRLTKAPEICQFTQPGFSCSENPAVVNQGGIVKVAFNLQNSKGQSINVSRVLCTTASLTDAKLNDATAVPAADQLMSAGATQQINATCKDKDGNALTLGANSDFRGTLIVYYNFENDVISIPRPADAIITGTVLGG